MIVSLLNLKGGVGKTTSCIALATAATRDGKDVIVLDADVPHGSTRATRRNGRSSTARRAAQSWTPHRKHPTL